VTSISEAWKSLERAESRRDEAARVIARGVLDAKEADPIRVQMFREAERDVEIAAQVVDGLLKRKEHSSD